MNNTERIRLMKKNTNEEIERMLIKAREEYLKRFKSSEAAQDILKEYNLSFYPRYYAYQRAYFKLIFCAKKRNIIIPNDEVMITNDDIIDRINENRVITLDILDEFDMLFRGDYDMEDIKGVSPEEINSLYDEIIDDIKKNDNLVLKKER